MNESILSAVLGAWGSLGGGSAGVVVSVRFCQSGSASAVLPVRFCQCDVCQCDVCQWCSRDLRREDARAMVTTDDVRRIASGLPRTEEHLIHDRVKFRVGQIVYVALSRDETEMGFAFPKEQRDALIASEPGKFLLPRLSDQRFNWVLVRLAALDLDELTELIVDAWTMVVPKKVVREHLARTGLADPPGG